MTQGQETDELSRNELLDIALEWGIMNPTEMADKRLKREIHEAHCIQYMVDNNIKSVPHKLTFNVDMKRKWDVKWKDGIKLRRMGCDFDTLHALVKARIYHLDQLLVYSEEQLIERIGIAPHFATLINAKISSREGHSLSETSRDMNFNYLREPQLNAAQECAMQRINGRKWSNNKDQSFTDFIELLEDDLEIVDPTKGQWIDLAIVLLEGEPRRQAKQLRRENPCITYDEWKTRMSHLLVIEGEPSQAIYLLCKQKYNPKDDPNAHFKKIEDALGLASPNASDFLRGFVLLSSLPYWMQNEIIPSLTEMDLGKIKNKIIKIHKEHLQEMKSLSKTKPGRQRPRVNEWRSSLKCEGCNGTGHTSDTCWNLHPELGPKRNPSENESNQVNDAETGECSTKPKEREVKAISYYRRMITFEVKGFEIGGCFSTGTAFNFINREVAEKIRAFAYPCNEKRSTALQEIQCNWMVPLKVFTRDGPVLVSSYVCSGIEDLILFGVNVIFATRLMFCGDKLCYDNPNQEFRFRMELPSRNEAEQLLTSQYGDEYNPRLLLRLRKGTISPKD